MHVDLKSVVAEGSKAVIEADSREHLSGIPDGLAVLFVEVNQFTDVLRVLES